LIFPRRACYSIARFSAIVRFYFSKKDKGNLIYNLIPVVKDEKKARECAREVFINFAYYLVDFFRYRKLNRKFIEKYVKVEGLDNLKGSFLNEKGAIALTVHLGNYELAAAVTAYLGFPLYVVALPHKDKRINEFFNNQRKMAGMNIISTGAAIKGCFSVLKQGKLLALLGDKDFTGGGLKLKMFSREASFPRGPAFFALRSGVDIIPAFFIRENKYFYRLFFEKPIVHKENSQLGEEEIIKKYIAITEKYIQKYPGQWYMFNKYWIPKNSI